jgi:hypothetical protein
MNLIFVFPSFVGFLNGRDSFGEGKMLLPSLHASRQKDRYEHNPFEFRAIKGFE